MKQLSLRGLEEGLSLLAEGLALDEGLDGCTIVEGYRLGLVEVFTIAEFLLDGSYCQQNGLYVLMVRKLIYQSILFSHYLVQIMHTFMHDA